MSELSAVKQALVQTQALERVQEAARRQGETQQQSFAHSLNRQNDARDHRVNDTERARQEGLDANAKRKQEEETSRREGEAPEEAPEGSGPEEEERGRHVDVRA